MHRPADRFVAAEREGQVRQAAGNMAARQGLLDPAGRLDKGEAIGVMFLDAGGDGENVRIEDNVLRRNPGLSGQQTVGPSTDVDLAIDGIGLALLVERHDHHGRAVAANAPGLFEERRLALLQADRIDDGLALDAFQPGLDDRPFGRIDHDRHTANVRFRRDQVEEADHRRLGIEHRLVHVDVDDPGAVFDLLPGDIQRRLVVAGQDQLLEFRRAGDVRALADHDEALGGIQGRGVSRRAGRNLGHRLPAGRSGSQIERL